MKKRSDLIKASELLQMAEKFRPELISLRRKLHQIPESGMEENKTHALIVKELKKLNIKPSAPLAVTGLKAVINGKSDKRSLSAPAPVSSDTGAGSFGVVGIRADMDGLSVPEESGLPFASKHPGMSHACGHDVHVTCLIGALRILNTLKNRFSGCVTGLFQPAEEGPGGAEPMIEEGALRSPDIEALIGLHTNSDEPVGKITVKSGPVTACTAEFTAIVQGKGGHASRPDEGVDAIVLAAQVINAWQTIVSRNQSPHDPLVITVGTINGGVRLNVIADQVKMTGTIRALNRQTLNKVQRRMETILKNIARAGGGSGTLSILQGYPDTVNHRDITNTVMETARQMLGKNSVIIPEHGVMGGEDISYFLHEVPGCFFFMGSGLKDKKQRWPAHHPKFVVDEAVIPAGSALLAGCALQLMGQLQP